MPVYFVNQHKLSPAVREDVSAPLECEHCLKQFATVGDARNWDCTKQPREHAVPCSECGMKHGVNGRMTPRTMTTNVSGLCDTHEEWKL